MLGTEFIPISVATLLPTAVVGLDLFLREVHDDAFHLYRGSDYPLTLDDLNRLKSRGVHRLFIRKESSSVYQGYLRKLAASSDDKTIPLTARVCALNEVVREVLEAAFQQEDTDKTVLAANKLSGLAMEIITRDEFNVQDLFQVLHHDYATFTHSANVAFYAGLLASKLGYTNDDVKQITIGGLLHDLGKLDIADAILSKPGKLDDNEFRQIRMHPILGFRKLAHRSDLSEGQLMMAYQHHERLDGRGYPVSLTADEIHPWAKMCSIVDVFEALTSHRPYRSRMPRSKAIEIQERDVGTAFDPEVFECWKSIILFDSAN